MSQVNKKDKTIKQHIVVGAGSSGIACAAKLLENSDVILIEQGEEVFYVDNIKKEFNLNNLDIPNNSLWTFQAFKTAFPIHYLSTPQMKLFKRQIDYICGNSLGGTSNINAMIFSLGHSSIYNYFWPKSANYKLLLESLHNLNLDKFVEISPCESNISKLIKQSNTLIESKKHGKRLIYDSNAFMPINSIMPCYESTFSNSANLRKSILSIIKAENKKGNLKILKRSKVQKINFINENANSVTVESTLSDNGIKIHDIETLDGEIVLCAGVFGSPQLLNRSGLNNRLPGLGKNLQDHILLPMLFFGNWKSDSFISKMNDRLNLPINGVHGWIYLDENGNVFEENKNGSNESIPSVQLLFVDGRITPGLSDLLLPRFTSSFIYSEFIRPLLIYLFDFVLTFSIIRWICGNTFAVLVCNINPKSRGSVEFSQDGANIKINPNFLSHPEDKSVLLKGFKSTRKILKNSFFTYFEILPGPFIPNCEREGRFNTFISLFATSFFHPCGTCRMGSNETKLNDNSVVDSKFRVHGVQNLRVADASIFPKIPTSPIAATCMAVGSLAAKYIQSNDK